VLGGGLREAIVGAGEIGRAIVGVGERTRTPPVTERCGLL
jgi:hypothetical protein